jgi:ribokinase
MAKITVVGSCNTDMVARVEQFPKPGQTVIGKSMRTYPGGKGANQCVAAARLGADAEMIGMLGRDAYGAAFTELFKSEGVKTEHMFFTDKEPTSVVQIQINDASENTIVVAPGANFEFTPEHLRAVESVLAKSDIVIAQLELNRAVNSAIIRTCARLGVPLVLNPAPAYKLSDEELGLVYCLTPNETELEILSGLPADTEENIVKAAKKLLASGVGRIVATLGKRGALAADSDGVRIIGGYRVKVVDTVAAGDSFNGALAKCLAEGKPLDDAVRYANAVGALTVTKAGAIPSLPTAAEVEEFLKTAGGADK